MVTPPPKPSKPSPPPPPPKRNPIIEKALSGGAASGTAGTSVISGSTTTTFGTGGTKTVTTPTGTTYTLESGQVVSNVSTSGGVPITRTLTDKEAAKANLPKGSEVFIPSVQQLREQRIRDTGPIDFGPGIKRKFNLTYNPDRQIYESINLKDNERFGFNPYTGMELKGPASHYTTVKDPMIEAIRARDEQQKQSFLDKLFAKIEMQPKEPSELEQKYGITIVPKEEIKVAEPKSQQGIKSFFDVFYQPGKKISNKYVTPKAEKYFGKYGEKILPAIDTTYTKYPSYYISRGILDTAGNFYEYVGIGAGKSFYKSQEQNMINKEAFEILKKTGSPIGYTISPTEPSSESLKYNWGIGGRTAGEIASWLTLGVPKTVLEIAGTKPSEYLKNPLKAALTVSQGYAWKVVPEAVKGSYLFFKTSKAGLGLVQTAPKVSKLIDVGAKTTELGFRYGMPIAFVTSEVTNIYGKDSMGLPRYPTYEARRDALSEFSREMSYFTIGGGLGSKTIKETDLLGYNIRQELVLKGTSMESLFGNAKGVTEKKFFKQLTKGASEEELLPRVQMGLKFLEYRKKGGLISSESRSTTGDILKGLFQTKKTTRPGNVPTTKIVYSLTGKGFENYKASSIALKELFKASITSERASGIPVKGGKAPLTKVQSLQGKFETLNIKRILDLGAGDRPSRRANYAADIYNYKSNLKLLKEQKPTKEELFNLKRLKTNYKQIDYNKKITGATNKFDEVLSEASLDVFGNKQAWKNVYNILKPGGEFNIKGGYKPTKSKIKYIENLGFKNVKVLQSWEYLPNSKIKSTTYNIVGTKPGKLPSSVRTVKGLPEVVFGVQKKYGLILGGSTILASYYTPKQMIKYGFKSPSDIDLFLPNKAGILTKPYLALVGSRLKKGFESKGLKVETELSSTSYKIFGYQKAAGAKKPVRTKLLELHSKELIELMPTGGIYTTQTFGDFIRGSFGFERIRRTTSGTKVLDIGTQKRNLLLGGFYADRASKDLPRFFKSLSLEMDYAKARGLSDKAFGKYISTKEKNLPFVRGLMKEQLFMRGESKDWKTLKVDFKFREPVDILEMFKSKPKQEKFRFFEPYSKVTKGYEPFKISTKQTYRTYQPSKSYSVAGSYKPYIPYKPYTPYKFYKGYGGYKGYEPYEPYKPYQPYKPYDPYKPYKPYQPYKPYDPYKPYQPYKPYKGYQPYKNYQPYKPIKTVPPPPIDLKFKIGEIGKLFKPTKKGKRKFKYTSTLRAVEFNIYGKMPKILTGFSDRPLLR